MMQRFGIVNRIWNLLNNRAWNRDTKTKVFITCSVLFFALLGFVVWLLLQKWLPGPETLICLIGYPAFFGGFLGSVFYLYAHTF